MLPKSPERSVSTSKRTTTPHRGKWVYCYLPSVQGRVKIVGESINYWVVDPSPTRVLKSACSSVPTTKAKAVRRARHVDAKPQSELDSDGSES